MFSVVNSNGHFSIVGKNQENGGGLIDGCDSAPSELEISYLINGNQITEIGKNAFKTCSNIESITIEEGYNVIGKYSFCQCYSLKSVVIPKSITILTLGAFEDCYKLSNFTILQNSNLKTIQGYTFNQCYNLSSIIIPSSVTYVGNETFSDISSILTIFYYPLNDNFDSTIFRNTPNVIIYAPINGAKFFGNKAIQHINILNSILTFKTIINRCKNIFHGKLILSHFIFTL